MKAKMLMMTAKMIVLMRQPVIFFTMMTPTTMAIRIKTKNVKLESMRII